MKIEAIANTNIALVKYWGKKDSKLKTPLNNSISMTLDKLNTKTVIEIIDSNEDQIIFNGKISEGSEKNKIVKILDLFRTDFNKKDTFFKINTENNFPTASGLASSASGFAALSVAVNEVLNLKLDKKELSIYARKGSGSASRSVFGGFAEWEKGSLEDGSDSFAVQIADQNHWDVRMLVTILEDKKKDKSSTNGMEETVNTCPFYPAWLDTIDSDLNDVRNGILEKDFEKVGQVMEQNCLKMHATMMTTKPSIIYWKPLTLEIIHKVRDLRNEGIPVYFTIDAGANVKVLCLPTYSEQIKNILSETNGIKGIIDCKSGSEPIITRL